MTAGVHALDRANVYAYVRRLVFERSAIVLDPSKDYLIDARLAPIVEQEGLSHLGALVERIEEFRRGPLSQAVVEAMTTNETSFFRDAAAFEAIRTRVLPELVARRASTRRLRIWSAACSSGQEPYSIAMTIEDGFPQLASWDIEIFATDLCTSMVERTRSAVFTSHEVSRGVPEAFARRYFEAGPGTRTLVDRIRRYVRAEQLNLVDAWPPMNKFDLVLLRNVLIYFDVDTKRAVVESVRRVLAEDGLLLLGSQETLLGVSDALVHVHVGAASVFRPRGP